MACTTAGGDSRPSARRPATRTALDVERYAKLVDWWASKGPVLVRGQGVLAIILGVLLAYALLP